MTTALAETSSHLLPEPVRRRGITDYQWRTLLRSLYPGAAPESVLMVWDYCKARDLDPLKKPCHIVPMEVKLAISGKYEWRDVIMPGVYEYRTTAQRTGLYLGHSAATYGSVVEAYGVDAPEWCELTIWRWNTVAAQRVDFPVRIYFREVVALSKDKATGLLRANARWTKAPVQMLTKCTEAAGLREAFPDEIGGAPTVEEMDGQSAAIIDTTSVRTEAAALAKPDGYDDWVTDMVAVADEGTTLLSEAWSNTPAAVREYLTASDPNGWAALKDRAAIADTRKAETEPAA